MKLQLTSFYVPFQFHSSRLTWKLGQFVSILCNSAQFTSTATHIPASETPYDLCINIYIQAGHQTSMQA